VPEDNITLTLYFALADTSGPYTIALTGAQARTMQRWLAARSGALLR
jgi:hypothetical protein